MKRWNDVITLEVAKHLETTYIIILYLCYDTCYLVLKSEKNKRVGWIQIYKKDIAYVWLYLSMFDYSI